MRNAILVTAAVATLTCPQKAWSQVSTTPTPLDKPFSIDRAYNDLQTLTRLYNAGEWARLEDATKDLLDAAKDARPPKDKIRDALDAAKHYIIVTWIGTDAFDKPMLVRVVVHGPRTMGAAGATDNAGVRGTPMVVDLPGVGAGNDPVYEVFFSRGTRGKIADVYVSSRDKNPISEELPAFVQAIASPLFETVGIFAGAVTRTENKAANGSIAATVSQVALPFERATIQWKAAAREPVTQADFESGLNDLAADLKFTEVPHSTCAQDFVDKIVENLTSTVTESACAADTSSATACRASIGTALAQTYVAQKCGSASSLRAPNDAEKTDLLSIDKKVRGFVSDNLTMSVDADLTFKNRPPTHWTFGLGSGVVAHASLTKPRVKLNDDTIIADPMPRVMTLAFVNWSPAGYDPEADRLSLAERVRPFFGATLTPDFGIAGGANVLLARGIGIVGGVTVMFAKGATVEEINQLPANPDQPFSISFARAVFVGISYNFK
jgi:hypothetical protein